VASEPGLGVTPGIRALLYGAAGARERPACGPGGARCKGGVSFVAGAGGEQEKLSSRDRRPVEMGDVCPLVARGRTPTGRNREGQSTARHSGGPARISDEGPVMGLERRGRAGQGSQRSTREGRSRWANHS